jgi:mediator of RNA polymerase II transcription subunit 16
VLELMAWLADTLLTLPTTLPPSIDLTNANTLSLPDLVSHLHSTNTVSLHLLLSSPTRGFLNAICRRLAHLDYIARKAIMHTIPGHPTANQGGAGQNGTSKPPALSPELRAAYMKIATLTSTATLRITTFETLLSSLTSHIKNAYSTHSPPLSGSPAAEKARNTTEIKMLFGGAIPDTFKGVIVELFRKEGLLDTVRNEIEPARLFFANFAMLEVDDDPVSVRERKKSKMTMDSFRKTWLASPAKKKQQQGGAAGAAVTTTNGTANGAANGTANGTAPATTTNGGPAAITTPPGAASSTPRWRRCARCAAVMEDVLSQRQVLQWMVMQQRRCFCGGHWETIDPTDIKSMRD